MLPDDFPEKMVMVLNLGLYLFLIGKCYNGNISWLKYGNLQGRGFERLPVDFIPDCRQVPSPSEALWRMRASLNFSLNDLNLLPTQNGFSPQ